tara:strand:- start:47 stop:361 length:315 start_codon:yes stop_codon:yes gene_type:complete
MGCFKFLFKNKIKNNSNISLNTNEPDITYNYTNNNSNPIVINGSIFIECAICFSKIKLSKTKLIYPCGHRLYCDDCLKQLGENCPNCRIKIHSFINVYENLDNF